MRDSFRALVAYWKWINSVKFRLNMHNILFYKKYLTFYRLYVVLGFCLEIMVTPGKVVGKLRDS
jgi:hypothetical protein